MLEIIEVKTEYVKDTWNKKVSSGLNGVALIHTTC